MLKFFKKDLFGFGVVIGLVIPAVIFFLLYFVNSLIGNPPVPFEIYIKNNTYQLVCIVLNVLPFRYYMINLKLDKTGRGILISTFAYAGVYVIFNYFLK